MRMVSAWLVVAGVVEESVTCTVKLKLPEAVGVPEMIPVAVSSARPPGSKPLLIVAVCAPTPPKMLTCVLKGAPTTPSGSVRERMVSVAGGKAIPVLAGCATPTGARLFNTRFCMSVALPTFARITTCPVSPGARAIVALVIAGSCRLGSPRFAAGVNTGLGTSATTMFCVLCARSQPFAMGVRYCFKRISCRCTPLANGARWKSFTAYEVVVLPVFVSGKLASVMEVLVIAGLVMAGFVIAGFVMAGLVIAGFVIAGFSAVSIEGLVIAGLVIAGFVMAGF